MPRSANDPRSAYRLEAATLGWNAVMAGLALGKRRVGYLLVGLALNGELLGGVGSDQSGADLGR